MPLTVEDFGVSTTPAPQGPAGPVQQQQGSTKPSVPPSPDQSSFGQTIRSYLPVSESTRNLLGAETPSLGDIWDWTKRTANYAEQRMERGGIMGVQEWANRDPETGRYYITGPLSGRRADLPEAYQQAPKELPRPDAAAGVIGSVLEGAARDPVETMLSPVASTIGSTINELAQGFPPEQRQWLAGAATMLSPRSLLHLAMHGLSHYGVLTSMLHAPSGLLSHVTDPARLMRTYIAGHEAGEARPATQPGRTNELTSTAGTQFAP